MRDKVRMLSMAWFGQGKDTIEWQEFRDDVLFYKWKGKEIKKGSKLIIRSGQKAIFYANGVVEGIFEDPGNFDIASEIVPFLSTLKGVFQLRGDSGLRAEVYFVNAKELLLPWGTRQRIMIPTPEVPSGIPVGCNGNMIIEFRDYLRFIEQVAGIRQTYSLEDIAERIMGEIGPILMEAILDGQHTIGVNALYALQRNNRKMAKYICEELDKELFDFGFGVKDLNIIAINYPEDVQKMAEKMAAQSFVQDVGRYATLQAADSMTQGGGDNMAAMGAQMAMGMQMGQMMQQSMAHQMNLNQMQQTQAPTGDRFCPKCRKMTVGKFCSDCGTETV